MHNIYTTRGIVLSSFDVGEADKFFRIFTRELGLIEATAQSVRKISSKNRYGLQDFSISDFSLVRGKEVWRITNVAPIENLFFSFQNENKKEEFNSVLNIFHLIKRFIHGEERNEELFDLFVEAIDFLRIGNLTGNDFKNFDLIVSIKALSNLGYFDEQGQKEIFSNFLKNKIDKKMIDEIGEISIQAERVIMDAIKESHL